MTELPQFPGCVCHDLIGEGSCGVVYAGTWEEDTPVAVKVFKPEAINRDYVKHCLDGLKNFGEHSGMVRVYDHDLDGDPAYCVMELLLDELEDPPQPQTLERICGQVSREEGWVFALQLADTLAHLHASGMTHCCVKTSNVFLHDDGQKVELRLSDPGQGWIGGVQRLALNDHTFYAAPEQLEHPEQLFGGDVESWDIYAFGVTVYRLVTGYFPRFEEELEELRQRVEEYPDEPIVFDPRVYSASAWNYPQVYWPDDGLTGTEAVRREIIERCLALNPADRYPDMRAVRTALAEAHAEAPTTLQADESRELGDQGDSVVAPLPAIQTTDAPPRAAEFPAPSKWRVIVPWAIAAVFAAGAGVYYKLHADLEAELAAQRQTLENTLAGVEGKLQSREADIQQNVSLVEETALRAGAAVEEQLRAQRNLAKAQDTADFFFTAFLESGSASADTPERRLAFARAEEFYNGVILEINGDEDLVDFAARAKLNLAHIRRGLGKREQAENGFVEAAEMLATLIARDPDGPAARDHRRRMASAQAASAQLLLDQGSYEEGLALLEKASDSYRPLSDQLAEDASLRHAVADLYQRTGWTMRQLERFDEAITRQARAIELLDPVTADPNSAPRDGLLLSKSLFERGRCRLRTGELDSAADDHIKAVEVLLEILNEDSEATDYRYQLGRNYWALGEALAESGLSKEAGRAHVEAVKYLKELVEDYPDVPEFKIALGLDYASVARIERDRGEAKSALAYQLGTVMFLRDIVGKAEATDLQRHELAVQQGTYAELLAVDNQTGDALDEARKGVQLLEEIAVKQKPGTQLRKLFQTSLAQLYGTLGDVAEIADEKEEAVHSFLKAISIWNLLADSYAGDPMMEKRLEWCKERILKLDPEALERAPEAEPSGDGNESEEGDQQE